MNATLLAAIAAALGVALGVVASLLLKARHRAAQLETKYAPIIDAEAERDRILAERDQHQHVVQEWREKWKAEYAETTGELEKLTAELVSVRDQRAMESYGLYEPQFDFEDPDEFRDKIKEIREEQKQMVRSKSAAICSTEWTVEGSKAKGRTMVTRQLRLMLRAFNGESDAAVAKVRYNNIAILERRIRKAHERINKLGAPQACSISPRYLDLKLDELRATHEYRERQEEIKQEQREIREQMREEERARREIEAAQREAEKDEDRYSKALEQAREEAVAATEEKRSQLEAQVAELEKRLAEAQENKQRAISRAQLTRSGHVYVVSNIGSFGKGIYKIGMTRRLDPFDRVRELSDASVPFSFDVHAIIYSKDAPTLETALHQAFHERRVNLINYRKEFFRVELSEIVEAVASSGDDAAADVSFTKVAEAAEWRQSVAMLEAAQEADEPTEVERARESLSQRIASWSELDAPTS